MIQSIFFYTKLFFYTKNNFLYKVSMILYHSRMSIKKNSIIIQSNQEEQWFQRFHTVSIGRISLFKQRFQFYTLQSHYKLSSWSLYYRLGYRPGYIQSNGYCNNNPTKNKSKDSRISICLNRNTSTYSDFKVLKSSAKKRRIFKQTKKNHKNEKLFFNKEPRLLENPIFVLLDSKIMKKNLIYLILPIRTSWTIP